MKIKLKTLDRNDEEVEIDDDAPLSALRKIIVEKMNVPEDRQRIIFRGRPLLSNSQLLKDYGVSDGLTLHMVERPADAIPPGLGREPSRQEHDGDEHNEEPHINIINGEMAIIRNNLFENADSTVQFIREVLANVLSNVIDQPIVQVNADENMPGNGDLTVRVRIKGSDIRQVDSGARSRISYLIDGLQRNERTLQILEREPFLSLTVNGYERVMPPLRNDYERTKFGETVLELEELLHIPRAELLNDNDHGEATANNEGASGTSSAGGSQTTPDGNNIVLRNISPDDYSDVLRRVLNVQTLTNSHIKRYQEMIRGRASMPNNRAKCIALCFEENFRRVLHRLSHTYHSISDLAVNFASPSSPLEPSAAENYDESTAEIAFTLVFVAQNGGPPTSNITRLEMGLLPFRFGNPSRDDLRSFPIISATLRAPAAPTVITTPGMMSNPRNRMPSPAGTSQLQGARIHVSPGVHGPLRVTRDANGEVHVRPVARNDVRGSRATNVQTRPSNATGVRCELRLRRAPEDEENPSGSGHVCARRDAVGEIQLTAAPNTSNEENEERAEVDNHGSNNNAATGNFEDQHRSAVNSASTDTAQFDVPISDSIRSGVESFIRNVLPNAFRNAQNVQSDQTGYEVQGNANAESNRQNPMQMPSISQVRLHAPIIRASGPTIRAPGIVGQVIVRTNASEGTSEAARRAINAALQAATATAVGENNGVHVQLNGIPRALQNLNRNRSNIVWARRAYNNRGNRDGAPEHPTDMFIGPHFPNETTIYTNDPHLNCQSTFCNPRTNIHNSSAYETLLNDLHQATIRYRASLDPQSHQHAEVDSLVRRWNNVRGMEIEETHVVLNQRGEAYFERLEHFKNVLTTMVHRALGNMAGTDADLSQRIRRTQGEYAICNYGMVPIISSPLHGFDMSGPPVGSIELDTVDIDTHDETQRDDTTVRTDTTQENLSSETVDNSANNRSEAFNSQNSSNTSVERHLADMMRSMSEIMQYGHCSTLAHLFRDLGHPVENFKSGFINLVMVLTYELLEIAELVQIMGGNYTPLNKKRQQMRRFLIDNVFNDNCRPSEEDIQNAAQRIALTEADLNRIISFDNTNRFVNVDGIGRVDVIASILRLDRITAEKFLRHVMQTNDGLTSEEYASTLMDIITRYACRLATLVNLSVKSELHTYDNLMFRFMDTPAAVQQNSLMSHLAQISTSHLRDVLHQDNPFTIHDMKEDVILKNADNETGDKNELAAENTYESLSEHTAVSNEFEEVADEIDEEYEQDDEDKADEAQKADSNPKNKKWTAPLPAEWLPVVEKDETCQTVMTDETFSEAYSWGRFSTKRKGMKRAMEGTVDGVVSSSVRRSMEEAISSAGFSTVDVVAVNKVEEEAGEALREDFDNQIRDRIANDPEYNPEKYPELEKFLKKNN